MDTIKQVISYLNKEIESTLEFLENESEEGSQAHDETILILDTLENILSDITRK